MMRVAEPSDFQAVCVLLRLMHAEVGVLAVDEQKAQETVRAIIESRQCLVCEQDGQIIASLGLKFGEPFWYSSDKGLVDTWFFIHPDHRGSNCAQDLILTAKRMARIADVPLWVGVSSVKKTVRKMLFLEKYMVPFGGIFYYLPEKDAA
ncbi:NAT_SF domain containing protein [uncultured Caudovirales phage]|uniref:NAT_SF domain containing protein n=1 Tax=uncultured Caudovirales phage TaxID=2100421 RepID=A0A6J5QVK2_9CAUD|nr:NAT_SF domain containing protein [uncultured Caudovirales phage]